MPGSRRKTTEAPGEDLLSTSPFDGDLAEELAATSPPRRRPPTVTLLLGAGALIVTGFAAGVQADKHWGANKPPDAAAIINQLAARRAGQGGTGSGGGLGGTRQGVTGLGGTGQGGDGASNGAATRGTVKLVDGAVVYVDTPDGVVRVQTTGATKITTVKNIKLKDLKAGSSVVVRGMPGQDGTVTATSVSPGG